MFLPNSPSSIPGPRIEIIRKMSFALSCRTRLSVLERLSLEPDEGLTIGEIKRSLRVPASSLTHHLNLLRETGLINQATEGREIRCFVNKSRVDCLIRSLAEFFPTS